MGNHAAKPLPEDDMRAVGGLRRSTSLDADLAASQVLKSGRGGYVPAARVI
jgi:hypothetical protein